MTEADRGPCTAPGPAPLEDGRCLFVVWAPFVDRLEVVVLRDREVAGAPDPAGERQARIGDDRFEELRVVPLAERERGYHAGVLDDVGPGTLYVYRLDGDRDRPDPASRAQPYGVHGPSMVVAPLRGATDDRRPTTDDGPANAAAGATAARAAGSAGSANRDGRRPLYEHVFYEIHVGTFTEEGTFDAVIPRLGELAELGVTALELMPVAQFPGSRNWGYDGVSLYAVQNSYGGPAGLVRLVDACHEHGLAVVLDVVYNHLGPEGNYLGDFGPYFTDVYTTPWGDAINFDGSGSDEVRRFFIANALYWIAELGLDGLRLDAVHAILDRSAVHFLDELKAAVAERAPAALVIAESDLNDSRLVRGRAEGGYGLDGQWSDDFHHALHARLTGERQGYYADFGSVPDVAKAYREGWVFTGQRSGYRGRRHGNSPAGVPSWRLVTFAQNHDQVGNRLAGDRLSTLVDLDRQKLAAGALLLSPLTPLLFMGEEYGETAPFPYFVSHSDPALVRAVRKGRAAEFRGFAWEGEPPDPQSAETFRSARPDPSLAGGGRHALLLRLHRELLAMRRVELRGGSGPVPQPEVDEHDPVVLLRYPQLFVALCFAGVDASVPAPAGSWRKRLDSADAEWDGPGAAAPDRLDGGATLPLRPWSFCVYARREPSLHQGAPSGSGSGGAGGP